MLPGKFGGASGKGLERLNGVQDRILQTCPWSGFQERRRCFVIFVSFCEEFHTGGAGCGIQQKQTKKTKKDDLLVATVVQIFFLELPLLDRRCPIPRATVPIRFVDKMRLRQLTT